MLLIPGAPAADSHKVSVRLRRLHELRPVRMRVEHARADLHHYRLRFLATGACDNPHVEVDAVRIVAGGGFLSFLRYAGEVAHDADAFILLGIDLTSVGRCSWARSPSTTTEPGG